MVNLTKQHISTVGSVKYSSKLELKQLRSLYLDDRSSMNGLTCNVKGKPVFRPFNLSRKYGPIQSFTKILCECKALEIA